MADTQNLNPVEQPESSVAKAMDDKPQTPDAGAPDLGLPKPFDASMHQALRSTVETMKQEVRKESVPVAPERAPEKAPERVQEQQLPEKKIEAQIPAPAVAAPVALPVKDEMTQRVEAILSEGLDDEYKKLPRNLQIKFRAKGEETTRKILKLLESSKLKAKKIISLILEWLRIIPHVNRYFLKQEAKIKADKIIEIKKGGDFIG